MKSHIDRPATSRKTINELINLLSSKVPTERNTAQDRLSAIGKPAVPALIKLTTQPEPELRREAAAILGNIHTSSAIPALINLLEDEAPEVRWRAAESLIKMERDVIIPLFQELCKKNRFDSLWFLEGVHHILRKLNEEGFLTPPSQKVLEAFNDTMQKIAIPTAAEKALEKLMGIA